MPEEELAERLFYLIKGGKQIDQSKIVEFVADNGESISYGAKATLQGGNGVAYEVGVATTSSGITTGAGLLAVDVGAAGVAIAPILGVALGFGLYSLAPEFWTNLSNTLIDAGKTIGGKVVGFFGPNQETGYDKETIEIFAAAFKEAGIFERYKPISNPTSNMYNISSATTLYADNFPRITYNKLYMRDPDIAGAITSNIKFYYRNSQVPMTPALVGADIVSNSSEEFIIYIDAIFEFDESFIGETVWYDMYVNDVLYTYGPFNVHKTGVTYNSETKYFIGDKKAIDSVGYRTSPNAFLLLREAIGLSQLFLHGDFNVFPYLYGAYLFGEPTNTMQENGVAPETGNITIDYPDYAPWYVPSGYPAVYPVPVPGGGIEQEPGQEGEQVPIPQEIPYILPALPIPEPNPVPQPEPGPQPAPDPDPTPQPGPEPTPEPSPEPQPNPIVPEPVNPPSDSDPGTTPPPSSPIPPIIVVPTMPSISSSALFTVYNPSMAQLNSLGAFLWSTSIIDQLKKIWQNPLDGIISLKKVYAVPSTSGSATIMLGNIDTNVSAPVVSSQFKAIDCGKIKVGEKFFNATDYSPYTCIHLYLPFIGIVEMDIDEVMDAELYITYSVDVYTGACLAEVTVKRTRDLSNGAVLYQFSGDCSQSIPLTASTASGLMHSIASLGAAVIGVASGGGALTTGYMASQLGNTLTHELIHVGRSGSLSSNPGILGQRKPYVILGRRNSYDANSYNTFWGYPANKTVYLGNCIGYTKVKAVHLQTLATEAEKREIEDLLSKGVIF